MNRSIQTRHLHWIAVCLAASLGVAMGQVLPDGAPFELEGLPSAFSIDLTATGDANIAYGDGGGWYLLRLPLHGMPDPVVMGFGGKGPPLLAMDQNGAGIMRWHDEFLEQILGQRFMQNATPVGDPLVLAEYQAPYFYSDLAMAGSGEFVTVWEDYPHISVRRFDPDGQPVGPAFQVSDSVVGFEPKVAMNASGEFVVAWWGVEVPQVAEIFARHYDSNGQPLGPGFQVNAAELGWGITNIDVALNDAGVFSIGWTVVSEACFVRHFDGSGPLHGEIRLNRGLEVTGSPAPFSLAMDANGRSVAFWSSRNDPDVQTVYGVVLTSAGLPAGGPFQPAPPPAQAKPLDDAQVAMTPEGDFLVMWHQRPPDSTVESTFGQRFTIDLPEECSGPTAPISITNVQLAGNDAILTLEDSNPPTEVTGYSIYRSTDPAVPRGQWTLWDWDATDIDDETTGIQTLARQWTHSGTPPLSIEYFEVTAYDSTCPAEGPR